MPKTLVVLSTIAILTFAGGYLTTDGVFVVLVPAMRNVFGISATAVVFLGLYRCVEDDTISEKWPFAFLATVVIGCFIASHAGWAHLVPTWSVKWWVQLIFGWLPLALFVLMVWPPPRRA